MLRDCPPVFLATCVCGISFGILRIVCSFPNPTRAPWLSCVLCREVDNLEHCPLFVSMCVHVCAAEFHGCFASSQSGSTRGKLWVFLPGCPSWVTWHICTNVLFSFFFCQRETIYGFADKYSLFWVCWLYLKPQLSSDLQWRPLFVTNGKCREAGIKGKTKFKAGVGPGIFSSRWAAKLCIQTFDSSGLS